VRSKVLDRLGGEGGARYPRNEAPSRRRGYLGRSAEGIYLRKARFEPPTSSIVDRKKRRDLSSKGAPELRSKGAPNERLRTPEGRCASNYLFLEGTTAFKEQSHDEADYSHSNREGGFLSGLLGRERWT